ncbi:MAG TPA: hypothetical protein PKM59_01375 [Thermodesulfobacteriota bacterium]|nr:hypothetical protein [Thermodesulfobacteriota bacterium]
MSGFFAGSLYQNKALWKGGASHMKTVTTLIVLCTAVLGLTLIPNVDTAWYTGSISEGNGLSSTVA